MKIKNIKKGDKFRRKNTRKGVQEIQFLERHKILGNVGIFTISSDTEYKGEKVYWSEGELDQYWVKKDVDFLKIP